MGDIPGEPRQHAVLCPAAYQRADAGIDLWADRDRLHDGLRHHRHDQFRPWRHFHGRRLHRPHRFPHPRRIVLLGADRHRAADHDDRGDAAHQPLQLDDREGGLPAAARFVPAGAADHRDRHVDRAVQFRPGDARAAQQADPADGVPSLHYRWRQRVAEADHHRRGHRDPAGAVLVSRQQDRR